MHRVLIVSGARDPHYLEVSRRLKARGAAIDLIDPEALVAAEPSFPLLGGKFEASIDVSRALNLPHNLDEYCGVWMRRLGGRYAPRCFDTADDAYLKSTFDIHASWIYGCLDHAAKVGCAHLFINSPDGIAAGENKMLQTILASQVGFEVPPTLISRSVDEIKAFAADHGRIVCKSLSQHVWTGDDGKTVVGNTFTRVLERFDKEIEDALEAQFSIFQPYIVKRREFRVFLIDGQAFCLAIQTEPGTVAAVDWRQGNPRNTRFQVCTLDATVLNLCRSLMDALDLRCASFDLIEDASGVVHFIETNQAGNFLWMEEDAGVPGVGDSFADALLNSPSKKWRKIT